ncbi:bifunctional riboflavin kinase/FMN phosphatase isoform X2 [Tanacetum coccineum]
MGVKNDPSWLASPSKVASHFGTSGLAVAAATGVTHPLGFSFQALTFIGGSNWPEVKTTENSDVTEKDVKNAAPADDIKNAAPADDVKNAAPVEYKLLVSASLPVKEINAIVSEALKIIGKTHIEAAAAIINQPDHYRLINHLRGHGVKMALASNSSRDSIETKISYPRGKLEKPSHDKVVEHHIFLEAAKRRSVDPSKCLVIEDSL